MGIRKRKTFQANKKRKPDSQQPVSSLLDGIGSIQRNVQSPANGQNRFALDKVLGSGGLCEVFLATDLFRVSCGDNAPQVAIKRLLPQYVQDCKARYLLEIGRAHV